MQDIALAVGATYFSEKTGDDLSIVEFKDLGHAAKVIVNQDSCIVLKDSKEPSEIIATRVEELWGAHKLATKKTR